MPRRSLFDDPFFGGGGDPFQQMNNMMNSMFNDPFFSGGMMGGMLGGMSGFGQQQQYPRNTRQQQLPGGSDGVTIEEVEEDGNPARHGRRSSQQEPVVEEPDERNQYQQQRNGRRTEAHAPAQRQRRRDPMDSLLGGMGMTAGYNSGGPGSTFCYSSTSYSSGGPGGVTYSSSTTTRRGANGVSETQRQEFDGRTGEETIEIARGLGDKTRTITRKRDGSGQERVYDNLNNLTQDEAARFDREWMSHANHLPSTRTRSTRRAMTGSASNANALEYGNSRNRYS